MSPKSKTCQLFLVFSLIFLLNIHSISSEPDYECPISESERLDCGKEGITETQCEAKGCCWKPSNKNGVPWCFYKTKTLSEQCTMENKLKIDCGFSGVSEEKCEERGCCWQPVKDNGVPWCFFTLGDQCRIENKDKLDCGYVGINRSECESKHCCWRESSKKNVPWCYNVINYEKVLGCIRPEHERLDCGYFGIDKEKCEEKGCCWKKAEKNGVPWCFYPIGEGTEEEPEKPITDEKCMIEEEERESCVTESIGEEECLEKGCCWHETEFGGVPFCYKKKTGEAVDEVVK